VSSPLPLSGLSRRRVLGFGGALGASLALGACGGGGTSDAGGPGGTTAIRNQLLYVPDISYSGYYIADKKGYYRQRGVNSSVLPGGPSLPSVESVITGGAVEVGLSDLTSVIRANQKKADLVLFGAQLQQSPSGLVSLAKHPIHEVRDLIGLRIGVQPSAQKAIDDLFALAGLTADVKYVQVGRDPSPLVDGACDAMTCYVTSQPITLRQRGIEPHAITFSELGLPDYANVLCTRRSYLDEHGDDLAHYLAATVKGFQDDVADEAYGVRVTMDRYGTKLGLDRKQQSLENTAQNKLTVSELTRRKGLFWMDFDEISGPIYRGLRASGVTDLPDPHSVATLDVLTAAFAGKTTIQ
jgi:ABC-type nitrate/sulfonate/bicarbonate transport system substrate-binding protein